LTLAVALVAATSCSGVAPAVPDANAFVRRLVVGQRVQEEALSRYTYDVTEAREDLDGKGRIVRRRTRAYQVYHVKGRPVRRLMARDGQPLTPAERERVDARAQELAQAIRDGRTATEQPGVRLSRVIERYDFRLAGREDLDGRCALVFEFAALPGDFKLERDALLRKLAGRLWVDQEDQVVSRFDAHNTGGLRIALGIAANVSSASLRADFVRLEPGLWLPRQVQSGAEGRKLLFVGFHLRETLWFDNYRHFEVSTDEKFGR